jgi:hypothetical protein
MSKSSPIQTAVRMRAVAAKLPKGWKLTCSPGDRVESPLWFHVIDDTGAARRHSRNIGNLEQWASAKGWMRSKQSGK